MKFRNCLTLFAQRLLLPASYMQARSNCENTQARGCGPCNPPHESSGSSRAQHEFVHVIVLHSLVVCLGSHTHTYGCSSITPTLEHTHILNRIVKLQPWLAPLLAPAFFLPSEPGFSPCGMHSTFLMPWLSWPKPPLSTHPRFGPCMVFWHQK